MLTRKIDYCSGKVWERKREGGKERQSVKWREREREEQGQNVTAGVAQQQSREGADCQREPTGIEEQDIETASEKKRPNH